MNYIDSSIFGGNIQLVNEDQSEGQLVNKDRSAAQLVNEDQSMVQPEEDDPPEEEGQVGRSDLPAVGLGGEESQGCLYDCVNDCVAIDQLKAYRDCVDFCGVTCE